jgi:hypothetical protein
VRAKIFHEIRDLARLAAADERRRIDVRAFLDDTLDNARAGGERERFKFRQLGVYGPNRVGRVDRN